MIQNKQHITSNMARSVAQMSAIYPTIHALALKAHANHQIEMNLRRQSTCGPKAEIVRTTKRHEEIATQRSELRVNPVEEPEGTLADPSTNQQCDNEELLQSPDPEPTFTSISNVPFGDIASHGEAGRITQSQAKSFQNIAENHSAQPTSSLEGNQNMDSLFHSQDDGYNQAQTCDTSASPSLSSSYSSVTSDSEGEVSHKGGEEIFRVGLPYQGHYHAPGSMARLRRIAPPSINTGGAGNRASSRDKKSQAVHWIDIKESLDDPSFKTKVPDAPILRTVPLPEVSPFAKTPPIVPSRNGKWWLPITPVRQALLNLLIYGSS
ncbi:hypothetical protein B0H34DRAFT_701513 [Crassisporium funariophilum]|nr:hypothetical protein B0H34DRAFT_701513 [Crassisporium funariophilum]